MDFNHWKGLSSPSEDLSSLLNSVACKLFPGDRHVAEYLEWSMKFDLIEVIEQFGSCTFEEILNSTNLTSAGIDALLGILCSLHLVSRGTDGKYALTTLAREYLLRDSSFYIGDNFFLPPNRPMPQSFLKNGNKLLSYIRLKLWRMRRGVPFGSHERLKNQQTRNLSASISAVETGLFDSCESLLDLAGGSGVFSIPLAIKYPNMKIVLADLPIALKNIQSFISAAGLEERIELVGLDVFDTPWKLPQFDCIYIGNFIHGFSDELCQSLCNNCYRHLHSQGSIWLHEMLWNDNKDGPLIAALWNASMNVVGGKQRTLRELTEFLYRAGFVEPKRIPTSTAMELVGAKKVGSLDKIS